MGVGKAAQLLPKVSPEEVHFRGRASQQEQGGSFKDHALGTRAFFSGFAMAA